MSTIVDSIFIGVYSCGVGYVFGHVIGFGRGRNQMLQAFDEAAAEHLGYRDEVCSCCANVMILQSNNHCELCGVLNEEASR